MARKNMFERFINEKDEEDASDSVNIEIYGPDSQEIEVEPESDILLEDISVSTIQDEINLPFPKSVLSWSPNQTKYTESLLNAGYTSIKMIATATVSEIMSLTLIPRIYIENLINQAKSWQSFNFETAANLLDYRIKLSKISTGSHALDELLGGGIEPCSITEFYGAFTTGKTQLCTQLALHAALPQDKDGLDGGVVYIDTEGSFRPERIVQMCRGKNIDEREILQKILVGRAHNTNIQMQLTNAIIETAESTNIELVIVDSLTSNFRAEFIGKGALMERQQKLNQHVQQLSRISDLLKVPVVITNQVMAVIDGFEQDIQPVGGNILAHGSTHRIQLTKSKSHPQLREAKLIASPSLPEGIATFRITEQGISDT